LRALIGLLGELTADQLTNQAYHAAPGISKSHLDTIAEGSPLHYWQRYINPDRPEENKTPALILGDAIHAAILQPALFESHYIIKPDVDKRTKDGKAIYAAFKAASVGKTELSQAEFDCCVNIRETVYRHPVARGLLLGGVAEHSFFTKELETGELIKCRPDYLTDDYIIDVKSTLDASEDSFNYDGTKHRYDVAVPWYMDIVQAVRRRRPKKWIWLVVEKEPPYAIGIYFAQEHDIIRARDTARRNFLTIIQHRRQNFWPDYGESAMRPFTPRAWGKR
jgi:exodeoxyribonuclease VIII